MTFKKIKIVFTFLVSFCCYIKTFAQKEKERISRYIEQYKELAMAEMVRTGIPAAITLAQGVLETGFGQSDLALNANNHFGIKCKSDWTGATILHDDDKKGECFRKYATVEDSYRDHSDFLRNRPNYAALFTIDPVDYSGWATGLKKAGYATNPTYADRIIQLIEENNLQQFTLLAMERKAGRGGEIIAKVPAPTEMTSTAVVSNTLKENPVVVPVAERSEDVRSNVSYPEGVFVINDTKVIYAESGTSLLAIANNHRITYSKLIEFNELENEDILKSGQLIYLEKKPKKGINEYHLVAVDETLHDICQKEGIQLASVMEFNHLQKGMVPAVGERLYLKVKAGVSPKLAMEKKERVTAM